MPSLSSKLTCRKQSVALPLRFFRRLMLSVATLILTACAAQPVHQDTDSPARAATSTTPRASQITEIDGQQVEYWLSRAPQARASLIFENGLMLPFSTWQAVISAFTDNCNVLVYNRAGVSRSTLPTVPQTPTQVVQQLRQLLQDRQLQPPYLLIGHSLGGQYVQFFAQHYPDQVSGMVLVDALPPGLVKPIAKFPWFTRLGLWLFAPEYAQREISNIAPLGERLLAEPGFYRKPMIRLVAATNPTAPKPEGLIKDLWKGALYAEDFGVWAIDPDIAEAHMDQLYPQAIVQQLQTPHRIQETHPKVVIDAINTVIDIMAQRGASAMINETMDTVITKTQ
ncbi:alpha/beta hydrolase [Chitinivorax sp. B]|uniref:alpha/beta hydrolase n=1 Tax=Chitinivorax sp. B TaxID=2502235 RepID=UPI001485110E|nr:alpha/beta hydrolase [Chitinivorax sp. B]